MTNYPKLVVQSSAEDNCNECFRFANQHKYATAAAARNNAEDDVGVVESNSDSDALEPNDQEPIELDDAAEAKRMRVNEESNLAAGRHVQMA